MAQTARWHLNAQHDALQIVAEDAGKVAQKCNPRDALHVIFSKPITTTPAAEPMMSMEPPTPAQ